MNDVTADAVAIGHCVTAADNGNGIVHGSGPFDNYIERTAPRGKWREATIAGMYRWQNCKFSLRT
jgi:hypothetical protein